jgi:hypothetical protein
MTSLDAIFKAHNLTITNVELLPVHGGSLRLFVQHSIPYPAVSSAVQRMLKGEAELGMLTTDYYNHLQAEVDIIKHSLLSCLIDIRNTNYTVFAYGAAAKGNTLLNYCGIKPDLIPYVIDKSIYKRGTYLPGSHIPVMGEDIIRESKPDYILILPWNLKDEIMQQLSYIREWNGHFIIPIPEVTVL